MTYFCPALDPPLGGSVRKTTTLVRDHEYFIPTKFHQNPSSGSGEEVENVKVYRRTTGRTTTDDGRTDDGRCAMTIAHLSLWKRTTMASIVRRIFAFWDVNDLNEIIENSESESANTKKVDSLPVSTVSLSGGQGWKQELSPADLNQVLGKFSCWAPVCEGRVAQEIHFADI